MTAAAAGGGGGGGSSGLQAVNEDVQCGRGKVWRHLQRQVAQLGHRRAAAAPAAAAAGGTLNLPEIRFPEKYVKDSKYLFIPKSQLQVSNCFSCPCLFVVLGGTLVVADLQLKEIGTAKCLCRSARAKP